MLLTKITKQGEDLKEEPEEYCKENDNLNLKFVYFLRNFEIILHQFLYNKAILLSVYSERKLLF